jgi:hypothetical protein
MLGFLNLRLFGKKNNEEKFQHNQENEKDQQGCIEIGQKMSAEDLCRTDKATGQN